MFYSKKELHGIPTIAWGKHGELKLWSKTRKVWLTGENHFTVEKLRFGKWSVTYQGRAL